MLRFQLSLILLLCSFSNLFTQDYNEAIKALKVKIEQHAPEDTLKVDLWNELSYAYRRNAPYLIDSFAQIALQLAEKLNYTHGKSIANKNLGIARFKSGAPIDTILYYYQTANDLAIETNDFYTQAACLNNIGLTYKNNLDYDKALKAYQQAHSIHEMYYPMDRLRLLIMANLGGIFVVLEDYDNALFYYDQVVQVAEAQNNPQIATMHIDNYAFIQHKKNQSEQAIQTIHKYLPIIKDIGDYQSVVQNIIILSDIYLDLNRSNEAEPYLYEAIKLIEQYEFGAEKCDVAKNLANIYYRQGKIQLAKTTAIEAYSCAEQGSNALQKITATEILLKIYLKNNEAEKADALFPVYKELIEKNFDVQKQKVMARLETEYQTKRKDAENTFLKAKQNENEVIIRLQRILAISISLIGLLATGLIFYAYRIKGNQNTLLEESVAERTRELNESYNELERSNQELERSNEELERFAYIASHDLKQPLNTVISFADLLDRELQDSSKIKGKKYLEFIQKGAGQMKHLIEDILEYSMLNKEGKDLQKIDLNQLVNEVLQSISELINRKNAHIEVLSNLPTIQYEHTKLLLVFKNLIENGIKYNESDLPTISIQHIEQEDYISISFSDNGIGIEEKYFSKLFKMFSRLENSDRYEGTGLGLSLCKKIMTNMGGTIYLESKANQGSTFTIHIPKALLLIEIPQE